MLLLRDVQGQEDAAELHGHDLQRALAAPGGSLIELMLDAEEAYTTYLRVIENANVILATPTTLIALLRDHAIELAPHEHRRNLTTRDVPLNHLLWQRVVYPTLYHRESHLGI